MTAVRERRSSSQTTLSEFAGGSWMAAAVLKIGNRRLTSTFPKENHIFKRISAAARHDIPSFGTLSSCLASLLSPYFIREFQSDPNEVQRSLVIPHLQTMMNHVYFYICRRIKFQHGSIAWWYSNRKNVTTCIYCPHPQRTAIRSGKSIMCAPPYFRYRPTV